MEITQEKIKEVMEKYNIGYQGFGTNTEKSFEYLPSMLPMVELSVKWLEGKQKTKSATSFNSYTLKHMVENWQSKNKGEYTYISSGAMIIAAIICDFPIRKINKQGQAYIGLSKKSLGLDDGYIRCNRTR